MKIAYIVLKSMPLGGGIEKYTEEVGSRLVQKGHEIIVYAMKHYSDRLNEFYKGMRIFSVSTIKNKSFEKTFASFIATLRNILDKNIDIVHYHAFGPSMFCIIPKLLGRKVVVQGHGIEWKRSRWGLIGRWFLKFSEIPSVKFPHKIIVVSQVQQKYLLEKYGIRSTYIPTGVNLPSKELPNLMKEKYGLNGNDYILFAARLVREKGAHLLIKAFNKLKLNSNMKLIIAGDALHEEKYKKELKKLAESNKNIIFTGFVTGKLLSELYSNCYIFVTGKLLSELYSNCYIFVLPSELEGLPIALLEAMSYGNCCLVSDIPENLEAIAGNGYTFKNKNEDDLSKMLKFLIENRDKVETVKTQARNYVIENYSWDIITDKLEKTYYSLLKSS